jgi:hypothetical protein
MKKIQVRKQMKRIGLIIFGLALLSLKVSDNDKLYWHERNQITWDDFTEVETLKGEEAAIISLGISYNETNYEANKIYYHVTSYMKFNTSLYIMNKDSDRLLEHEQGHFDIAEIYARKIRKHFSKNKFDKNSFDFKMKFKSFVASYNECQKLYDKETNYSKNGEMQEVWNKRIEKQLKELKKYKEIEVVCRLK